MTETSLGVGRVVVLVLFSVLFVSAWRSDHARNDRFERPVARREGSDRIERTLVAKGARIGAVLPGRAAAFLTPAHQTNGLTIHSDRGIEAALRVAVRSLYMGERVRLVESSSAFTLGARLVVATHEAAAGQSEYAGSGAVLTGSSDQSFESTATTTAGVPEVETEELWTLDGSDTAWLEETARLLR